MAQYHQNDQPSNSIILISFKDDEIDDQYPSITSKHNNHQSLIRGGDGLEDIVAIKKSSFVLQDEEVINNKSGDFRYDESFSGLNSSVHDEVMFKYKPKDHPSSIKQHDSFSQKDIYNYNQSIFSDKISSDQSHKISQQSQQHQYNNNSYSQSVYMTNVQQQKATKPCQQGKKDASEISVIFRSMTYFLENRKKDSLIVDGELIRDLYDEFFKREIFIPLFKYERYDEWNKSKDKFQFDSEVHRIFKANLQKYVDYINSKYPQEFMEVFHILEKIQRGKILKKRQNLSAFSFLNFDFTSIVETLKHYISSSKTEILRNTLLAKLKSLRTALKYSEQHLQLVVYKDKLIKNMDDIWDDFAQIQLLLNFEQTQYYCTKKIENSLEPKFKQIWVKYRQIIRQEKNKHIQKNLKDIII